MNLQRIGVVVFLVFIAGISVFFAQHLSSQENKHNIHAFLNKGNHLVNLVAVYPVDDVDENTRAFFLKTLSGYASEGLAYLYIHDLEERPVLTLAISQVSARVPGSIISKSLYALGSVEQHFTDVVSGQTVYEFAKPIYRDGEKSGTIRLGLELPPPPLFSLERLSLVAMIAFFVISALAVGYYGITFALRPLWHLIRGFRTASLDSEEDDTPVLRSGQIAPMVGELEQSLGQIQEKLGQIEAENIELTSRLSVTAFEKNQILKIIDSVNFGIIIIDVQENINQINEYMLQLLGKARDEVVDHQVSEVIGNPEILSFIVRQEATGLVSSTAHINTTFPESSPDETYRITSGYLMGGENTPIGLMLMVNNVTAESMVESAQQDFIAHVAHELLTPLQNIKSYSEMLMDGEIEDAEMEKEFYNTINDQTDRLSGLIRNLLSISQMEMGSLALDRGLVRTDWFVDDCLSTIEGSAKDKEITIERDLPDMFPSTMADKELLKVAFNNVLGNAVKYTPNGGSVTFRISEEGQMVCFEIRDTGYGISEEDQHHVFEKFYRSEDPEITGEAGSGLGLATTAEIIQLHDGEITVESQLGEGTTFKIRLPKEEYTLGRE